MATPVRKLSRALYPNHPVDSNNDQEGKHVEKHGARHSRSIDLSGLSQLEGESESEMEAAGIRRGVWGGESLRQN